MKIKSSIFFQLLIAGKISPQHSELTYDIHGIAKDEGTHNPVRIHSTPYPCLAPILHLFRGYTRILTRRVVEVVTVHKPTDGEYRVIILEDILKKIRQIFTPIQHLLTKLHTNVAVFCRERLRLVRNKVRTSWNIYKNEKNITIFVKNTSIFKLGVTFQSPCIFNSSFLEDCLPDGKQISIVVPVLKSGNKSKLNNCTPIAVFSQFVKNTKKLLEKHLKFFD